jgi:tetratricopeptide (TPR) repeat protein
MTYELKTLAHRNLESAVGKAEHYRDLNQPEDAVSICRDVLNVAPNHERALRTLALALTDQLGGRRVGVFEEALATIGKLTSSYERTYYAGVAWERYAKEQVAHGHPANGAHAFEKALELFEQAEKGAPPDSPDPILGYNRCVRAIQESREVQGALSERHYHEFQHGD